MKDDVKIKCEQSFYKELYHSDEASQGIIFDETSGRVLLKKTLDTYNIEVYRWLKDNRSIHIPFIHSFREEKGKLIVLEEYIQGDPLDKLLSEGSPDRKERIRIILELCDALIFLHSAPIPIIHRDIKASNIMLSTDGIVKLIDYDAAKIFHAGKRTDTTLIGTVGAAAPEQYGFAQSDARTDIYSLGVLIRELFPNEARYAGIVNKATQMEPGLRFQNAGEMKRAFETASSDRRHRGVLKGLAIFAALIAVIITSFVLAGIMRYRGYLHGREAKAEKEPKEISVENGSEDRSDTFAEPESLTEADGGSETTPVTDVKDGLVISESFWSLTHGSDEAYVDYCVILENSTEEYTVNLPAVNVTARSAEGIVLGTDRMVGASIMPGDKGVVESLFSIPGDTPSDINISFELEKAHLLPYESDPHPRTTDFTIRGVNENNSGMFPSITGEFISHYSRHLEEVKATAVLRNKGKIVASDITFISDVEPENPKAFEFDLGSNAPIYDEIEIYICEW